MAAAGQDAAGGRLAENVVHFARLLRRAGLPIGPAKVLDALQALQAVGLERRDDFYYALSAVLVDRHEQQAVFDQAFSLFWRDPGGMERRLQDMLRQLGMAARTGAERKEAARRVTQAWLPARRAAEPRADLPPELQLDASLTESAREVLQRRDFATMSGAELLAAKRMIAAMRWQLPEIRSRRARPRARGRRIDPRASLRQMMKNPDDMSELRYRMPCLRPATLVLLCDISGSMDSYTRMLLHFMHAVSNQRSRVHSFLFGTRLSNITRALRGRDVDAALDRVARQVGDWAGGTRIADSLSEFNRHWARRLLGQGAVVLLISDGLDSGEAPQLGAEMARLRLACRRLIWLNPLLRYSGFEARAAGIRAMLPHVDSFLPAHNLASLEQLGALLSSAGAPRAAGLAPSSAFLATS